MEHKEYIRICDHAAVAVLFIHGIVGTPNHFHAFVPLVPENFSVYNLLLDGHGKGVRDFAGTSMRKWEEQVNAVVEELSLTHEKIYIVAHSLGTLLAIEQSLKNKKVSKLFLLAVPLRLALKPKMAINACKVFFDKVDPDDHEAIAAKNCYGVAQDRNPLHYFGWVPRFLELFAKMRQTREMIGQISSKCTVYQSAHDEMVARQSEKYLKNKPNITVNVLQNSGHYHYAGEDFARLLAEFERMLHQAL